MLEHSVALCIDKSGRDLLVSSGNMVVVVAPLFPFSLSCFLVFSVCLTVLWLLFGGLHGGRQNGGWGVSD